MAFVFDFFEYYLAKVKMSGSSNSSAECITLVSSAQQLRSVRPSWRAFFAARVWETQWWKWRLLTVQNPILLSKLAQMVQSSFMIIKVSPSFWHLSFRENEKESFLLLFFRLYFSWAEKTSPYFLIWSKKMMYHDSRAESFSSLLYYIPTFRKYISEEKN